MIKVMIRKAEDHLYYECELPAVPRVGEELAYGHRLFEVTSVTWVVEARAGVTADLVDPAFVEVVLDVEVLR